MKRFHDAHVREAIARRFPYCPKQHIEQVVPRVLERDWNRKVDMATALSIVVHNHIRHNLTDYEHIIGIGGVTRKEARLMVKPELDDWFEYWQTGYDRWKPNPGGS